MGTRTGRLYTTEAGDARIAATWLNEHARTDAGKRMLELRAKLESLLRLREPGRALYLQRVGLPELNTALQEYVFSPALIFDVDADRFQATTLPRVGEGPRALLEKIEICESTVAAALVRLTAAKRLSMLHQCDFCRTVWHLATREIDRFCSARCRDAWHARSPEYAERKRQTQREYRANKRVKETTQNAVRKGLK